MPNSSASLRAMGEIFTRSPVSRTGVGGGAVATAAAVASAAAVPHPRPGAAASPPHSALHLAYPGERVGPNGALLVGLDENS